MELVMWKMDVAIPPEWLLTENFDGVANTIQAASDNFWLRCVHQARSTEPFFLLPEYGTGGFGHGYGTTIFSMTVRIPDWRPSSSYVKGKTPIQEYATVLIQAHLRTEKRLKQKMLVGSPMWLSLEGISSRTKRNKQIVGVKFNRLVAHGPKWSRVLIEV